MPKNSIFLTIVAIAVMAIYNVAAQQCVVDTPYGDVAFDFEPDSFVANNSISGIQYGVTWSACARSSANRNNFPVVKLVSAKEEIEYNTIMSDWVAVPVDGPAKQELKMVVAKGTDPPATQNALPTNQLTIWLTCGQSRKPDGNPRFVEQAADGSLSLRITTAAACARCLAATPVPNQFVDLTTIPALDAIPLKVFNQDTFIRDEKWAFSLCQKRQVISPSKCNTSGYLSGFSGAEDTCFETWNVTKGGFIYDAPTNTFKGKYILPGRDQAFDFAEVTLQCGDSLELQAASDVVVTNPPGSYQSPRRGFTLKTSAACIPCEVPAPYGVVDFRQAEPKAFSLNETAQNDLSWWSVNLCQLGTPVAPKVSLKTPVWPPQPMPCHGPSFVAQFSNDGADTTCNNMWDQMLSPLAYDTTSSSFKAVYTSSSAPKLTLNVSISCDNSVASAGHFGDVNPQTGDMTIVTNAGDTSFKTYMLELKSRLACPPPPSPSKNAVKYYTINSDCYFNLNNSTNVINLNNLWGAVKMTSVAFNGLATPAQFGINLCPYAGSAPTLPKPRSAFPCSDQHGFLAMYGVVGCQLSFPHRLNTVAVYDTLPATTYNFPAGAGGIVMQLYGSDQALRSFNPVVPASYWNAQVTIVCTPGTGMHTLTPIGDVSAAGSYGGNLRMNLTFGSEAACGGPRIPTPTPPPPPSTPVPTPQPTPAPPTETPTPQTPAPTVPTFPPCIRYGENNTVYNLSTIPTFMSQVPLSFEGELSPHTWVISLCDDLPVNMLGVSLPSKNDKCNVTKYPKKDGIVTARVLEFASPPATVCETVFSEVQQDVRVLNSSESSAQGGHLLMVSYDPVRKSTINVNVKCGGNSFELRPTSNAHAHYNETTDELAYYITLVSLGACAGGTEPPLPLPTSAPPTTTSSPSPTGTDTPSSTDAPTTDAPTNTTTTPTPTPHQRSAAAPDNEHDTPERKLVIGVIASAIVALVIGFLGGMAVGVRSAKKKESAATGYEVDMLNEHPPE